MNATQLHLQPLPCSCCAPLPARPPVLQPQRAGWGWLRAVQASAAAGGGPSKRGGGRGERGGGQQEQEVWDALGRMAAKYLFASGASGPSKRSSSSSSRTPGRLPIQAVHILLSCYALLWLLTALPLPQLSSSSSSAAPLLSLKALSLDALSSSSNWVTRLLVTLTDAFSSSSGALLARNLFFGYMFGRVVQNTEGGGALCLTFGLSAAGGSVLCLSLLPRRAPLGGCAATAALAGLFAAAVLFNRHKQWHWQRLFELGVLLPFVVLQLLSVHQGLSSAWSSWAGFKIPGAWLPLLGGVLGAAAAAGVLAGLRAVQEVRSAAAAERKRQQRQQKQQQQQRQSGGGVDSDDNDVPPLPLLLAKAAARMLRKGLGS